MTQDTKELLFKVATLPTANAGRFKTLMVRATIMESEEPIVHLLGPGDLRIDAPWRKRTKPPRQEMRRPRLARSDICEIHLRKHTVDATNK